MNINTNHDLVRISKRMSYALRHRPHAVGLTLDEAGWVGVPELLAALHIDRSTLATVVAGNDKQRFAIAVAPDGSERIRASQGHSVDVDLGLEPVVPPAELFHGTPAGNLDSILRDGSARADGSEAIRRILATFVAPVAKSRQDRRG